MKPFVVNVMALFVMLLMSVAYAKPNPEPSSPLPIVASNQWPALLLDLGAEPMNVQDQLTQVTMGEVVNQGTDNTIQTSENEVTSLHPGFGRWNVDYRFRLSTPAKSDHYQFWARWRQGGEPDVCVQNFEIWAGPDAEHLAKRATFNLKPKGWESAWIQAENWLKLNPADVVIEVRDSGAGHDAKVFDAFLLAPVMSTLPVSVKADKPVVLLELGKLPAFANLTNQPGLQIQVGTALAGLNAESVATENDEVQVFHQGFGDWQANFKFDLNPAVKPGRYRFYARYKSGGEVSQVTQRFTVKAGEGAEQLATRGELTTTNNTPWAYQWLEAAESITLLPGDHWLEITNSGKADGAKVFDAFLLEMEAPVADWMSLEQAQARNRFLALSKAVPEAKQHLLVLDGKGEHDQTLFAGLATSEAQKHYEKMAVSYYIGEAAEALAHKLNIATLPAALISDDHYTLLGVLSQPQNTAAVLQFLADPVKAGSMPLASIVQEDKPTPLQNGMPEAWLVGGLQDGLAGVSIYGLDSETVLRPNLNQPYLSMQMMGGDMQTWQMANTQADGSVDILKSTQHAYGWSRGTGYAQIYLHAEQARQVYLHLSQSGIKTAGWLDGQAFQFSEDPIKSTAVSATGASIKTLLNGLTTEGLLATALADRQEPPQWTQLNLTPGWHSLLIKLVMQHDQGQRFYFKTLFTDAQNQPINAIQTQLNDPDVDLSLNRLAAQLRPLVFVDAPANLPQPGDELKLRIDMRWQPILEQNRLPAPLPRFQAKLRVRLMDYQGNEIAVRDINDLFPGQVEVNFGPIAEAGYYAVYPSLHTPAGQLIMNYPADGFSVVPGAAEQKLRLDKKKLWNNDYYALADGDNSFRQIGGYFSWLQRMGIFKSYGSYPGFDAQYQQQWALAKNQGLQLFADSAGDSNWLNDNPEDGRKFIQAAAGFSRYFKSTNEIDIRHEPEWQKLREPAHWVARAKWEFEQIHQARKDGHYVGGSLVRPAEGDWFKQVLQLGLDQYQDAWDVHAYPQKSPRFGQPLGNGSNEDEQGVLAVYASLGKKNRLPFWLGETGAKAMHGYTGRRWQAEQVAKIIAWVNSRSDYLGLAFCIAHEYDQAYGRIWDYSMGHKPGEAALYTASALIDGLQYQAIDTGDKAIQAAQFGSTIMIWRDDANVTDWQLKLDPAKDWVRVDVVGHRQDLPLDSAGQVQLAISGSPIYVLPGDDYQRLTRK